jgi:hypothetical protein
MRGYTKRSLALALLIALALPINAIPASSAEGRSTYSGYREEPTAGWMILDLLVARPAGLAASVIGVVAFIASLPFSAPAGNADVAAEKLVADPVQFTFGRPLGVFDTYGASTVPDPYRD